MSNVFSEVSSHPRKVPWGNSAILFLLVLTFLAETSFGYIFYKILVLIGISRGWFLGNTAYFLVYGLSSLVSAGLLWLFLKNNQASLKDLGLSKKMNRRSWGLLLIGIFFYLLLTIFSTLLVRKFLPWVNLEEAQDIGFSPTSSWLQLILIFLSLVITPPLVEEALFRGFVFRGLRNKWSFLPAAILSALIFGLFHFQLNIAIDTAALGFVLAWLYEKSDSLWPSILLHSLKNLTAFALIFIFKV